MIGAQLKASENCPARESDIEDLYAYQNDNEASNLTFAIC